MVSPDQAQAAQDDLRRISGTIGELIEALRAQRQMLRQRGMGLPPGTLGGLKTIQAELEKLADQLTLQMVELEQLRALAHTTALVNSSLDINQVLNEVMDTVIALTEAERGYIVLRDTQTGHMRFRIARNLDRQTIDEGSFIVSRTIVEEVAQTGEPVVTTNAQSDPRFSSQESVVLHALRSILCVPLRVRGQVTGVVYADNRIKDGLFGEKALALLVSFANQAAIAIENARLYERVQTALAEITEIKELMENVFASIASGVITTDEREVVTTYNVAAEHILRAPAEDVLGNPLARLSLIYHYVQNLVRVIYEHGTQELLEIEPELPEHGPLSLNLKLTPLKNQDMIEGVAIVVDDLTEIKRRDATLDLVRRYLPPAMVDNIQSLDGLGLGGERRVITALFIEVRPFSSFPPHLSPGELMEALNLYLTVGAEAIHNQTGVIDKFMGNEIMGLFNTQLNPGEDHAWCAVRAALKIAEEFLALPAHLGETTPVPYHRIGIHTGVATVGNLGSASRREFTAIGDTVNLAKRLQENAQPGQIIISQACYQHCQAQFNEPDSDIIVIEHPSIQVKGRRQETEILEIRHRDA